MDSVIVRVNLLPEIVPKAFDGLMRGLSAVGFAIQEQAQINIRDNDQIDTGAMLNALYTETPESNGRDEAVSAALARAQTIGVHTHRAHPEMEVADVGTTLDPNQVKVADAMEHGVYQELGTDRMVARPYLTPAAEEVRGKAEGIVSAYVKEAIGG